ncbi:hypothetical protein JOC34_000593 [Virgibacillus halotolerans]|uniref:hypothetical protein n=1 Tax=Virgibacillus halotolerans TaxID=1071053 RepID=UPI001961DEA6|nr:hypothetical protein [Virgibacillus halotolerans]MBM7598236.1 hypothetical protein [Virgibacillus halotolerans]
MLKFDNISIEYNYETLEMARGKVNPIAIEDERDGEDTIELTLDQAKWLRDNINYIIKRLED